MSGNIPQKTEEDTKLMDGMGNQIEDPKQALNATVDEYERLENHRATLDANSINSLPPEILNIILQLVVKGNPTHVRGLLLVCKHWAGRVLENPQIWNTITLRVPYDCWDVQSWANLARLFIKTCLERSQSALLDITVDFDHLRTFEVQRQLRLGTSMVDDRGHPLGTPDHTLDDPPIEDPQNEPISVCNPIHALDIIRELVGPERTHTTRWQSLKVTFSSSELALKLWDMIIHPFPNVTRISFVKLFRVGDGNLILHFPKPFLPRIEHLSLDVGEYPKVLSLFPLGLRRLSVKAPFEVALTLQLSRFTNLSVLTLNEGMRKLTTDASSHLSLPNLQELNLTGTFQPTVAMDLDLPCLRRLMIEWSWRFPLGDTLPVVQPSILQWAPYDQPQGKGEYKLAKGVMRMFLLHFTGTATFVVPYYMKDVLFDLMRELSSDGLLSTSEWKTLALQEAEDMVETVKISEVLILQEGDTA